MTSSVTGRSTDYVLSPKQLAVTRLIAQGKTNRQIGATLGMSARTVQVHLGFIFKRVGVRNRTGLAIWAIREGLTNEGEK